MNTAAEIKEPARITMVEPASAEKHWEYCFLPMIKSAMDKSPLEADRPACILEKIMAGSAILLQIDNGAELLACAVLELVQGKKGQLLHVYAVAGVRMDEWLDEFIQKLHATANKLECVAVSMTGRPGWCRELPCYGFRTELITMTMRVK